MSDDIQVGNINPSVRPIRKPLPKKPATESNASASVTGDDIAALNVKMDQVLKLMQAIDWKMWVYLKANNYID